MTTEGVKIHCKKSGEGGCYGVKELTLLLEISNKLNRSRNVKDCLNPILKLIAHYINADRAILAILNRQNGKVMIEEAYGLSEEEKARGIYEIGEGIIGKVVATGNHIIIPKISEAPDFLNKTKSRIYIDNQDVSFICVPVKNDNDIVGALSVNRIFNENIPFDEDIRLLALVGSIIASAVKSRQEYMEEIERLMLENTLLHDELKDKSQYSSIVGKSGKMQHVYDLISRVAPTNATVLIRGESGVGKELIADAIHYNSARSGKPFVKVNCAALPESLIESELFGHEKGAFTGAQTMRVGRFEMADGGTIFLDEIGDLPAQTQIKLLRILQEREFERLGSNKPMKIDVRIVCATNRNLEEIIEKGIFREDLYYRINVFPIFIPALKERITDIPALVDHFISEYNRKNNARIRRISSAAIDILMMYHWPGNIRELENCIERACIMSVDNVIRSHNLPPTLQTAQSSGTKAKGGLETILGQMEQQLILETLQSTKGNMAKAAEVLKITERMLGIRIAKYQIDTKRFKPGHEKVN